MRTVMKRLGRGLAGVVALVLVLAIGVFAVAQYKLRRVHEVGSPLERIASDEAALARGEHVARIHGCQQCHGNDMGGKVFLDIPPGVFVAPNLTTGKGGVGNKYRLRDWDRAVRMGVRHNGRALLPFMPSRVYHGIDDADAAALAAWLENLPPVDRPLPATTLRPIGYVMAALHDVAPVPDRPLRAAPPRSTAEFGAYRARTVCGECHGNALQGGKHPAPQAPPGPALAHTGYWSPEQFAEVVRSGMVGKRKLDEWMPSADRLRHLDDVELESIHLFIRAQAAASGSSVGSNP